MIIIVEGLFCAYTIAKLKKSPYVWIYYQLKNNSHENT